MPVWGPNSLPFVRPDILSPVRCCCDKKLRLLGGGIWLCLTLVEPEIILMYTFQYMTPQFIKFNSRQPVPQTITIHYACVNNTVAVRRCQLLLALAARIVNNNQTQYSVCTHWKEEGRGHCSKLMSKWGHQAGWKSKTLQSSLYNAAVPIYLYLDAQLRCTAV